MPGPITSGKDFCFGWTTWKAGVEGCNRGETRSDFCLKRLCVLGFR